MPASPATRISPVRGLRADNHHKRGHSLESGILFRERDDDLALFNEVQNKEKDRFLLQSNDDFDDIFARKLRYFTDYKHRISLPARGESSDLLNTEGDKNDYDWLITPPDTPLFPSLDDEAPLVSTAPRGRPRSQPISISRSSIMEKGYRSARSSASPHRFTSSPGSGSSPSQPRSRPFSATHSSPPPALRHYSPSRRLSPPPSKRTIAPRSRTPTPRRLSTGSTDPAVSSKARRTSPIKKTQGNTASLKIKSWQSNIPGFSSEAPPNLRTSLADRPASYLRGSSPTSRNDSRSGRQSTSPTASRIGSSQSHEKEQFSPYNRGSIVLPSDDDVDSVQSNRISNDHSVPRNTVPHPSNRAVGILKKTNTFSPNSASKRSFDLAVRQMEQKGPQNMFRPLLSNVPNSTLYVGKPNCPVASMNSPVSANCNANSDQGTSAALDAEESAQKEEDVTSNVVKGHCPMVKDEVFVMDQAGATTEGVKSNIIVESPQQGENVGNAVVSLSDVSESQVDTAALSQKYDSLDVDDSCDNEVCSKCSRRLQSSDLMTGVPRLCLECKCLIQLTSFTDLVQVSCTDEAGIDPLESVAHIDNYIQHPYSGSVKDNQSVCGSTGHKKSLQLEDTSNLTANGSEDTGISLLLKRSSNGRGHIIQSRSFTASNTSYDDFSYSRGSLNSMKSSIGYSSASLSSSVDLGSSRQSDPRIRQSIGRKFDMENYRNDTPSKHKRSISSLSGASGNAFQITTVALSSLANRDAEVRELICQDLHDQSLGSECTEAESTCTEVESNILLKTAAELSVSREKGDDLTDKLSNEETLCAHVQTATQVDDATQSSSVNTVGVVEDPHSGLIDAISELETENASVAPVNMQPSDDPSNSIYCRDELLEPSVSVAYDGVTELDTPIPLNPVHDESSIVLEDDSRKNCRSLTLEEATDTILFCSSIVHNLAYEAANIAINKESSPVEAERLAVTYVGETNSYKRDTHLGKQSPKSWKVRQRRLETDAKPSPAIGEADQTPAPHIVRSPSKHNSVNPPKQESKCNCVIM